jgi:hypothetical protein
MALKQRGAGLRRKMSVHSGVFQGNATMFAGRGFGVVGMAGGSDDHNFVRCAGCYCPRQALTSVSRNV